MQIRIKNMAGNVKNLHVEADTKLLEIKQSLEESEGIDIKMINLIFQGKQMLDERPLSEYNYKVGDTINMVMQMRGGRC